MVPFSSSLSLTSAGVIPASYSTGTRDQASLLSELRSGPTTSASVDPIARYSRGAIKSIPVRSGQGAPAYTATRLSYRKQLS